MATLAATSVTHKAPAPVFVAEILPWLAMPVHFGDHFYEHALPFK